MLGPKYKFFFAGDTGYCDVFKQIGRVHGPFDLSAIPIGAYEPRYLVDLMCILYISIIEVYLLLQARLLRD